jgi:formylglycine-generating enzyme required for sulfatase activity
MHGNVWEWCLDHWHNNYTNAPIDGSAWLTDNQTAARLLRGGSWFYSPAFCRFAPHNGDDLGNRDDLVGFRMVLRPASVLPIVRVGRWESVESTVGVQT